MNNGILVVITLLIGSIFPFQAVLNSRLGSALNNPLLAAFVSFFTGTCILFVLLLITRVEAPTLKELQDVPGYLYLGGLIGITLIVMYIIMAPLIGVANAIMAAIVGQLIMSIIIDHYGLLNMPVISINPARLLGAGLLLAGLYLIQKKAF